jgi:hypothetical protein
MRPQDSTTEDEDILANDDFPHPPMTEQALRLMALTAPAPSPPKKRKPYFKIKVKEHYRSFKKPRTRRDNDASLVVSPQQSNNLDSWVLLGNKNPAPNPIHAPTTNRDDSVQIRLDQQIAFSLQLVEKHDLLCRPRI